MRRGSGGLGDEGAEWIDLPKGSVDTLHASPRPPISASLGTLNRHNTHFLLVLSGFFEPLATRKTEAPSIAPSIRQANGEPAIAKRIGILITPFINQQTVSKAWSNTNKMVSVATKPINVNSITFSSPCFLFWNY